MYSPLPSSTQHFNRETIHTEFENFGRIQEERRKFSHIHCILLLSYVAHIEPENLIVRCSIIVIVS